MAANSGFSYNKQFRSLCFTIWVDQLPEHFETSLPATLPVGVRVLAYQAEICPESGRRHIQVTAFAVVGD